MNDIDLMGNGWSPIGNDYSDPNNHFQGNFNGNGKVISNLAFNKIQGGFFCNPLGLFGSISNANIHDVGVRDCNILTSCVTGGLVGWAGNSTINRCYTTGKVSGASYVGGLVGNNDKNTIVSNCYSTCNVSGENSIGGLVGGNSGFISDCYTTGNIMGTGNYIGGLAGINNNHITYCYALGEISGGKFSSFIGGITGTNKEGTLINCVAANEIVTTESNSFTNINRITGNAATGMVSNNYAFQEMKVTYDNGFQNVPLVWGSAETGTDQDWATLMSFNFYNCDTNDVWLKDIPWSISTEADTSKSWRICDGQALPRLQWEEGFECEKLNMFCGGDGTQANPYLICTAEELAALATFVNAGNGDATSGKYYKLKNDIDLSEYTDGKGWAQIGNNNNYKFHGNDIDFDYAFQGYFDGNGKTIYNLTMNRDSSDFIGLFGITLNTSIHDIGIEECYITGGLIVGALVGWAQNSTVNNCYATGSISGNASTGGLVGWNFSSTTSNCYSACRVSGRDIENGTNTETGGLVGINTGTIRNSYATGNIFGAYAVGGLAGWNTVGWDQTEGIITDCYATGNVTGTEDVGGLAGRNWGGSIKNCVAANDTVNIVGGYGASINRIAGNIGSGSFSNNYANENMVVTYNNGTNVPIIDESNAAGTGKDMATLMSFNFYNTGSNWYNNEPWSIDTVANPTKSWRICDGEILPFLQWQTDIECSPGKAPYIAPREDSYFTYTIEQKVKPTFSIYPNPTSNSITISSENIFHNLEIVNLLGQTVHYQKDNGNSVTLDVSSYRNGVYFVRIISENGVSVQKFVKQ